jgi:hypothetical protein
MTFSCFLNIIGMHILRGTVWEDGAFRLFIHHIIPEYETTDLFLY